MVCSIASLCHVHLPPCPPLRPFVPLYRPQWSSSPSTGPGFGSPMTPDVRHSTHPTHRLPSFKETFCQISFDPHISDDEVPPSSDFGYTYPEYDYSDPGTPYDRLSSTPMDPLPLKTPPSISHGELTAFPYLPSTGRRRFLASLISGHASESHLLLPIFPLRISSPFPLPRRRMKPLCPRWPQMVRPQTRSTVLK